MHHTVPQPGRERSRAACSATRWGRDRALCSQPSRGGGEGLCRLHHRWALGRSGRPVWERWPACEPNRIDPVSGLKTFLTAELNVEKNLLVPQESFYVQPLPLYVLCLFRRDLLI